MEILLVALCIIIGIGVIWVGVRRYRTPDSSRSSTGRATEPPAVEMPHDTESPLGEQPASPVQATLMEVADVATLVAGLRAQLSVQGGGLANVAQLTAAATKVVAQLRREPNPDSGPALARARSTIADGMSAREALLKLVDEIEASFKILRKSTEVALDSTLDAMQMRNEVPRLPEA